MRFCAFSKQKLYPVFTSKDSSALSCNNRPYPLKSQIFIGYLMCEAEDKITKGPK